jgi:UDP-glucose 4-epimerase
MLRRTGRVARVTWLLTGGAGYIGSHIVRAFAAAGTPIVVLDNLASGYRDFVPSDVPFVEGSVTDAVAVAATLDYYAVTGVVHLAGLKYAGVSVSQPLEFFRENVYGMQVLLEAVRARGIDKVLLSSSASWYGTPDSEVVTEQAPARPESPYGQTKVASEWLLRSLARAAPELRQTSLRYFNVVGSGTPELADHSPHNLFPKVLKSISAGGPAVLNGTDYATPDGTCIRDYVHVVDVADAHLRVAQRLDAGDGCAPAYNVGRGTGSSVREVLDTIRATTGIDFPIDEQPRRPGDPARIVGSVELISADLAWHSRFDLSDMVTSAWEAWQYQLATYGGAPSK